MRWALLLAILISAPAWADVDYRCLQACVNEGATSAVCLGKCSYNQSPVPAAKSTHEVFAAPKPAGNAVVLAPKSIAKAAQSEDYICLAICGQSGLQYVLCEERCAKPLQK